MKKIFYSILSILVFVSCASEREWQDRSVRFDVKSKACHLFAPSEKEVDYAMDSTFFNKMVESGTGEFCAMLRAFSMSELTMERRIPTKCQSQVYNLTSCEAFMDGDTVKVVFECKDPRRSLRSHKMINLSILDGDHTVEVYHAGGKYIEVENYKGQVETRKSPSSTIIKSRLILNKPNYSIGDTLIGELVFSSFKRRGRRSIKTSEYTEGKFRAIVSGGQMDCQEKLLVTSALD